MSSARCTLKIGLARPQGGDRSALEYTFKWHLPGRETAQPVIHLIASEQGLPDDPTSMDEFESWRRRKLPDDVVENLRRPLLDHRPDTVWLDFERPRAHLTLIPWEMLLQPLFDCAVARVSPLGDIAGTPADFGPRAHPPTLALCASMPRAKSDFDLITLVSRTVRSFVEATPNVGAIHVFVDSDQRSSVSLEFESLLSAGLEIEIHDPNKTEVSGRREQSIEDTGGAIVNPWMTWMAETLVGQRIDAVAFCCHGYHRYRKGALSFARSPRVNDDAAWSRFVGGEQLSGLLERLGSRLLMLQSPPHNFSAPGLFAVAEVIAQLRTGTVAIHDASIETGFDTLSTVFARALGERQVEIPKSAALSLFMMPGPSRPGPSRRYRGLTPQEALEIRYGSPSQPKGVLDSTAPRRPRGERTEMDPAHIDLSDAEVFEDDVFEDARPASFTKSALAFDERIGWVAASKRRIENSRFQQERSASPSANATRDGVEDALELVAQLVAKHSGEST